MQHELKSDWMSQIEEKIVPQIKRIEQLTDHNQWRVIRAFQKHKVSDFHFNESTGYGYNDTGREVLDAVYAEVMGTERALVRPHFASGTHAITVALFSLLRPGDHLLYITGQPYDTLRTVIAGTEGDTGSLADWHIDYDDVALQSDGKVDWGAVTEALKPNTRVIGIQRSRGYEARAAFCIDEIAEMVKQLRILCPDALIFVDNCYGEFTEHEEPGHIGVDLMAGSLIKNPGGGLVSAGGYIAGREHLVEKAACRLFAPGIGSEVGAMLGQIRSMYQGLFMAPHAVGEALKGSVFAAAVFAQLGFTTFPAWDASRSDLIQAVHFDRREQLIAFVQSVQKAAPVDAHVTPEPWGMPGYEHEVIMAAGTFFQGGSLELSADAPIREPYMAYLQGGLTYSHVKLAVKLIVEELQAKQLLS